MPAHSGTGSKPARPSPWASRTRGDGFGDGFAEAPPPGLPADLPEDLLSAPGSAPDFAALPGAGAEPIAGIERRLSNRAESLWTRLCGHGRLPPQAAAQALLARPFAAQAMLVEKGGDGPVIVSVGTDLLRMAFARPGPVAGAPCATDAALGIGERLAALALDSIAAGRPLHLDSDFDPDIAPGPGGARRALLFRAVALPFAPDPGGGLQGLAVALLSWRALLSDRETEALHRELHAAIAWMGRNSRKM